jgi:hypothetical protein
MRRVTLFAEDFAHESFLAPLLAGRLSDLHQVPVELRPLSVRGGFGAVEIELERYVKDLLRYKLPLPDAVVVVTDANCLGIRDRKSRLAVIVEPIKDRVVFAIPDPHIEKWLLMDPAAFRQVLGTACATPDYKCQRDRYKQLLIEAVQQAGLEPLLGGVEHAEDIVAALDLHHVNHGDFKNFLEDMEAKFRLWKTSL